MKEIQRTRGDNTRTVKLGLYSRSSHLRFVLMSILFDFCNNRELGK
jgi:hypothetical protein